jgi:hypothetical protein
MESVLAVAIVAATRWAGPVQAVRRGAFMMMRLAAGRMSVTRWFTFSADAWRKQANDQSCAVPVKREAGVESLTADGSFDVVASVKTVVANLVIDASDRCGQ